MARLGTTTITGDLTVSSSLYTNTLSVENIEATSATIPTITGDLMVSGSLQSNSFSTGNIEASTAVIPSITGDLIGSASNLNLQSAVGSSYKPVYFTAEGVPVEIGYSIRKNVPSNAVFTDTLNTTGSSNNSEDTLYFLGAKTASEDGVVSYTKSNVYMDAAGNINAPSFVATSSKKYKENIEDAKINATELINQIKIVNFNFIADDEKNPKVGFIAEDTNSLFSTPHKNVMDITNCIGILLKANQELSKRIEELEKRLEEK